MFSSRRLLKTTLAIAVAAAATAGLSVVPALADTPGSAPAGHRLAVTLDQVALQVTGPDVPAGDAPYVAAPGSAVQVASIAGAKPYSYLSVTAVPFGETLPQSVYPFPESKAGDVAAWTRALHGTANGPVATIFGQKVRGTVVRSHGNMTGEPGSRTDIQAIEWIVNQGSRTWVVNLQHDASTLPAGFGRNLAVASGNSTASTSVDPKSLSATSPAPLARTPMVQPFDAPLTGNLGLPSWWSSTCDGNGSPLSSSGTFMGLQVCGGGSEQYDHVPGVAQYEWQCADLSDRYLVQRYGLDGPGGNGNEEAANWHNAYPGKFQLHSSGDGTAPTPGDVISFAVGSSQPGHTGVVYKSTVDSSGTGTVYFVDQNWTGDGGYNQASVTNWRVQEITGEGGTVQWLHNPADGVVQLNYSQTAAADFTGDGQADIIARDSAGNLKMWTHNAGGYFSAARQVTTGWNFTQTAAADFSGDGKADIIARDASGNLKMWLGNGDGTFGAARQVTAGWDFTQTAAADFDGNGKADIIARDASGNLKIWAGRGDGTFGAAAQLTSGWDFTQTAAADFNGDGQADIVARDASGNLKMWTHNAGGYFNSAQQVTTGWDFSQTTAADFDGNGKADLIGRDDSSGELSIWAGHGDTTFGARTDLTSGW